MRALITAFPLDVVNESNGLQSLRGLAHDLPFHGVYMFTSFHFFVELELDPLEMGRDVTFTIECVHPDGGVIVLMERRSTVPTEMGEYSSAALWALDFHVPITITKPGPYPIQLKADGELVAHRTLHVFPAVE